MELPKEADGAGVAGGRGEQKGRRDVVEARDGSDSRLATYSVAMSVTVRYCTFIYRVESVISKMCKPHIQR